MKKLPAGAPYKPAQLAPNKITKRELASLKAVQKGEATEEQQRVFWIYVTEKLCGTYDLSYRPDSVRDTDFAEGKRFVGLELVKLSKAPATIIEDENERRSESDTRSRTRSSGEQPG